MKHPSQGWNLCTVISPRLSFWKASPPLELHEAQPRIKFMPSFGEAGDKQKKEERSSNPSVIPTTTFCLIRALDIDITSFYTRLRQGLIPLPLSPSLPSVPLPPSPFLHLPLLPLRLSLPLAPSPSP